MRNYDYDTAQTIVVPDGVGNNNFLAGMLASACQSKGLDASAVMALCNVRNGGLGNFGINEIIALVVIAALFGGNGNGLFGGNNNNSTERQMLMMSTQAMAKLCESGTLK